MIVGKAVIIPDVNNTSQNTLYFDSINDFPLVGQANTLYVDRTTKFIHLWQGEGYESADFMIPSPPQPPAPDTLFFDDKGEFPITGQIDKIYVSKDNGISWTWSSVHEKYLDNQGRINVYKAYIWNGAPYEILQNTFNITPTFTYPTNFTIRIDCAFVWGKALFSCNNQNPNTITNIFIGVNYIELSLSSNYAGESGAFTIEVYP